MDRGRQRSLSFFKLDMERIEFEKVVNALEERHFHAFYHDFGCTFYHPKMLLATLLFAYFLWTKNGDGRTHS